jgi:hypothetical protein
MAIRCRNRSFSRGSGGGSSRTEGAIKRNDPTRPVTEVQGSCSVDRWTIFAVAALASTAATGGTTKGSIGHPRCRSRTAKHAGIVGVGLNEPKQCRGWGLGSRRRRGLQKGKVFMLSGCHTQKGRKIRMQESQRTRWCRSLGSFSDFDLHFAAFFRTSVHSAVRLQRPVLRQPPELELPQTTLFGNYRRVLSSKRSEENVLVKTKQLFCRKNYTIIYHTNEGVYVWHAPELAGWRAHRFLSSSRGNAQREGSAQVDF